MNTKEKIFDVSLDLFSKKGYDSVSLREIAEEVGIKKSSIYSHYPSKEAILMDIFNYFTQQFEFNPVINNEEIQLNENNPLLENPELFYHKGSEAIKQMIFEETNFKIMKLILIQMHHNETIKLFFQNEILVKPLIFWNGFFTMLKEKEVIRKDSNPKLLAKQYYSFPIYFPDSNGSAAMGQATTAIDPALVEGPDGTIYCFADMNPTGITTFDIWPGPGTGFVEIGGKDRLVLTGTYVKPVENVNYGNPEEYEYYVGDFDAEGFAHVLKMADGSETAYVVDEWYNIYTVNAKGEYEATLTQKQVNSNTSIQQNAFYAGSVLHVYSTGYIWCVKSYDGGMSWEDPEILNTQIKRNDGKETALLVSPGQGMVTSDGDIIVGAYDTYNGENASIFYSTDNGLRVMA